MKIVIGTYEGFLYGWDCYETINESGNQEMKMKLAYGYAAHIGCIKSVSIMHSDSSSTLVSGGEDEMIKIYNLKKKVETGSLVHHKGAITCLDFYGQSHLLSASSDKNICIWRTSDWNCVHILAGHKGEVNDIGVHPSGKLALSVSRDRTLRMWNLVKGRNAYIRRLEREATSVFWSTNGNSYGIIFDRRVSIYNSATGELDCNLDHKERVNAAVFLNNDIIVTAGENKVLHLWQHKGRALCKIKTGSSTRIRSMVVVERSTTSPSLDKNSSKESNGPLLPYLVSASSDGHVEIWNLEQACSIDSGEEFSLKPIGQSSGRKGMRVTCLAACYGSNDDIAQSMQEEPVPIESKKEADASVPDSKKTTLVAKPKVIVEMENENNNAHNVNLNEAQTGKNDKKRNRSKMSKKNWKKKMGDKVGNKNLSSASSKKRKT